MLTHDNLNESHNINECFYIYFKRNYYSEMLSLIYWNYGCNYPIGQLALVKQLTINDFIQTNPIDI